MPNGGLGLGPLGSMPLGGWYSTVEAEVNRADPRIFRRVMIKRRSATTGQYETSWQDVSEWVERYGTIGQSIDDTRPFRIRHDGYQFQVRNDTGEFTHHSNPSSLWFGYMTRHRSLVKVEAGYLDDNDEELPYDDVVQGVFIMDDEVPNSTDKDSVTIRCTSLQSAFESVKARELPGMNSTMTAEALFTKIKNHTDGAGVSIFQQYISSGAWTIPSTTNSYIFPTDTALQELSVWEIMEKVAEAENKVCLINRSGGLELIARSPRTTTSAFSFYGQGFREQNTLAIQESKEAINKVYASFRLKYIDADTSTSFVSAGTTTTVSPSNVAWQVGNNVYDFENFYVANTATAQAIVSALFTDFSALKIEDTLRVTMVPSLELLDRVDLSYRTYDLAESPLWDVAHWDDFEWGTDGENFDLDAVEGTVISKKINLDDFTETVRLRRV